MSDTMLNVSYGDVKSLKNVLNTYHSLCELAGRGNANAIAIKLDIENMLMEGETPLTEQKAYILKLYYIEGYTQLEIAKRLNITQEAVSYAMSTATKTLSTYWRSQGE